VRKFARSGHPELICLVQPALSLSCERFCFFNSTNVLGNSASDVGVGIIRAETKKGFKVGKFRITVVPILKEKKTNWGLTLQFFVSRYMYCMYMYVVEPGVNVMISIFY
jgi:hypothetical protein